MTQPTNTLGSLYYCQLQCIAESTDARHIVNVLITYDYIHKQNIIFATTFITLCKLIVLMGYM